MASDDVTIKNPTHLHKVVRLSAAWMLISALGLCDVPLGSRMDGWRGVGVMFSILHNVGGWGSCSPNFVSQTK